MTDTQVTKADEQSVRKTGATETEAIYIPDVDVTESHECIRLVADMPGVDRSSVEVSVENNVLTIEGHYRQQFDVGETGLVDVVRKLVSDGPVAARFVSPGLQTGRPADATAAWSSRFRSRRHITLEDKVHGTAGSGDTAHVQGDTFRQFAGASGRGQRSLVDPVHHRQRGFKKLCGGSSARPRAGID